MRLFLALRLSLLTITVPAIGEVVNQSGKAVFERHCSHCHAPGIDHPGTLMLSVTRGEVNAVLEQRKDLTAEYVKLVVRQGLKTMPAFKPTTLTHEELKAVVDYLNR
jgi:mono/diheme cytochrome c family protein